MQEASIMSAEKGITDPPPLGSEPPFYTFGQLWQVPLFLLGLTALAAVWATRPLWYDPEIVRLRSDLDKARQALQDPQAALNGLTVLLQEDLDHIGRLPERAGEAHFLLGSIYLRLAGQLPAEPAADLWRKARSHLEEAEQLGVPEPDRILLRYRLGMAWFQSGGDVQRVIATLSTVIDQVEEDRAAGYEILTQCYLRLPVPNLPAALAANEKQLQLPTSDESRLAPARLLRGELLLRMHQDEAARKVLGWIKVAPPAISARARYLRAHSYQEEKAWAEAAKLWEEVLADERQPPADKGRVLYWLGWCYRNLHQPAKAARCWESIVGRLAAEPDVPARDPRGRVGLISSGKEEAGEVERAASLRLANLQMETGKLSAALELYDRALKAVHQPADYHNRLVNLSEAAALVASDCRACKDSGKFADAVKLARLYAKLVLPGTAQSLLGQIAEAWADAELARSGQQKDGAKKQQEAEAARVHFREAAAAYEAAAQSTASRPGHQDLLWHAAACFSKGQDFPHAITAYQRFVGLQPRPPADQLGEAWYRLGEARRALHDDGAAKESYHRCIEVGGYFAYWAQYQLAMAEVAAGNSKDAQDTLEQNLDLIERAGTTPNRAIHEKTLYALAEILFSNGDYISAARLYDQATNLYPASPRALLGRYNLAQCYRDRAAREFQHLQPNELASTPTHFRGGFNFWLEKAAAQLQTLVDDLQAPRQTTAPLPEADARLLTQARFALADCRFRLGAYTDAIPIYRGLANQYDQQLEGLVAHQQLYFCYVMMPGKPAANLPDAQHTLQEMHQALEQIDESTYQGRPEAQKLATLKRWLKTEEERLQMALPPK
jgi:tetratricopeptide (TPR) repeat protein